ncbi:MAG: hypothetical protein IPK13_24030 [Deltaproteobacteria bacterium]|nr:hypothetical protein [Deltaproteobacteria bacterium]
MKKQSGLNPIHPGEMKRIRVDRRTRAVALSLFVGGAAAGCGGSEIEPEQSASIQALMSREAELEEARACVVAIAEANTDRLDNIDEVRARLEPYVELLADSFLTARRYDEVTLTQGTWKSLWFDDDDIGDRGFFSLDRSTVYQVVEDGYYYNVAENQIRIFGIPAGTVHSFLKGNYQIVHPATDENFGEPRLNVIDLEFDQNRIRFGHIPSDRALRTLVDRVERQAVASIEVPGPKGITGELWNLYIDADLRIAAGVQDDNKGVQDLYILRRATWAGPLAPYSERTEASCL